MKLIEISYNETVRGKQGRSFTAKAELLESDNFMDSVNSLKAHVRKALEE